MRQNVLLIAVIAGSLSFLGEAGAARPIAPPASFPGLTMTGYVIRATTRRIAVERYANDPLVCALSARYLYLSKHQWHGELVRMVCRNIGKPLPVLVKFSFLASQTSRSIRGVSLPN